MLRFKRKFKILSVEKNLNIFAVVRSQVEGYSKCQVKLHFKISSNPQDLSLFLHLSSLHDLQSILKVFVNEGGVFVVVIFTKNIQIS